MAIEDEVRAIVSREEAAARERLNKDRLAIELQLTEQQNAVAAKERELTNEFIGFRLGAIAPAFQTGRAEVMERNFFKGRGNVVPEIEKPKSSLWPLIFGVGLIYFVTKKG